MQINKLLTPYNHNPGSIDRIKYIVIHYVGALGGAKANCQWYAGADRGASAHYFVDFDGSVWQSVEDKDIAWHCGAKSYRHPECRNANSIGIEMCVRNKGSQADTPKGGQADTSKDSFADTSRDWYFEDATVAAAIELTRMLMDKYHIPADHVIRHYDVTGKICPNPYVYNTTSHTWAQFKAALEASQTGWIKTEYGWWYRHEDGSYTANGWEQIDGKWYWFNESGYAYRSQWVMDKGKWYYLGDDCAMVTGLQVIGGKLYYFGGSGAMATEKVVLALTPDENGALH